MADPFTELLKKRQGALDTAVGNQVPLKDEYFANLENLAGDKRVATEGWSSALASALPALLAGALGGKSARYAGATMAPQTSALEVANRQKEIESDRAGNELASKILGKQLEYADREVARSQDALSQTEAAKLQDLVSTNRIKLSDGLARGRALEAFNRKTNYEAQQLASQLANPAARDMAIGQLANYDYVHNNPNKLSMDELAEALRNDKTGRVSQYLSSPQAQSMYRELDNQFAQEKNRIKEGDYSQFPSIAPINKGRVDPKLAAAAAEREALYTSFMDKAKDLQASMIEASKTGDYRIASQDANDMVLFMANFLKRGANFTESEQAKISGLLGIPVADLFTPEGIVVDKVKDWASSSATPEVISRLVQKFSREAATELRIQYKHYPTADSIYGQQLWDTGRFDNLGHERPEYGNPADSQVAATESMRDRLKAKYGR